MGAGALGSAFGGMLAEAGHDVTLIGRERYMKPIKDKGLIISGLWGSHVTRNIRATTELDGRDNPEVVLLTTKSFDTETAVRALQPLISDDLDTVVVSLQNGIGNEECIAQYVGEARTLGGMCITGF